jgi:hypothetical protein
MAANVSQQLAASIFRVVFNLSIVITVLRRNCEGSLATTPSPVYSRPLEHLAQAEGFEAKTETCRFITLIENAIRFNHVYS